jgi:glycosyltransferase involved in cell wall biosynthesis
MRILHVIESTEPDAGSSSFSLVELVRGLGAHGIESQIVAESTAGAEQVGLAPDRKPATHACQPETSASEFDVVHLHGWRRRAQPYARCAKRFILSPLGQIDPADFTTWRQRWRWRLKQRKAVRRAAVVTAMNEWEQEMLRRVVPEARVELLPLGLSTDAEGPRSLGSEAGGVKGAPGIPSPHILVLGSIDPASGAVALLKALAELGPDADGWSVVFAWPLEARWRQMLEAAVRRKGGEGRVVFVAAPDAAAQRGLLAQCGMLVAPAMRSRPPIAMMQAIAAGVPACGTKCAAPAEIECMTCEPNRSAMREMLRGMLRMSESERRETASRLQAQAKSHLDWSHLVDRYIRLYHEVSAS